MTVKLSNQASSLLSSSITGGDTVIPITSGDEAKFPTLAAGEWCPIVVYDGAGNVEIMRATARDGINLTVTRAQEGTTAKSFAAGARVDVRLTKAVIDEIITMVAGGVSVDCTGGADKIANVDPALRGMHNLTGAITADISYVVPASQRIFEVKNSTSGAHTVTVKTPAGSGVVVPQGSRQILMCDGVNVVPITSPISDAGLVQLVASQASADYLTLKEQGAAPAHSANTGSLYTKDVAGATELFYKDHTGNETQLTNAGNLKALSTENTWSAVQTHSAAIAMSGAAINEAQGADIVAAATINLDVATGNLIDVTGNSIIVTVNLAQGRRRTVRFTGTPTLTHGSLLVLPGGANIVAAAGDVAEFRGYAGGVVRCVSYTRASGLPVVSQPGVAAISFNGLKIATADGGTSSVVTATRVVLLDSSNKPMLAPNVNVTVNFASVGAAGIDSGAIASNSWYHLWVIGKPDGTVSAIGSLSSSAPAMPSGYTFKARVGAVRTQAASAVFAGTIQVGAEAQYVGTAAGLPQMASGTASRWTAVAVGAFVPSTAAKISVSTTSIGGVCAVVADNAFGAGGVPISHFVGGYDQTFPVTLVLQSTNIYWSAGDSRNRMYCIGWMDNL